MRSLLLVISLAACAHSAGGPVTPSYTPIATTPASPRALLYADCLAEAAGSRRVAQAQDASTSVIVFTCRGEPARAFYEGLAARSAQVGSQFEHGGRTFRATNRVQHDLFGVDYCATDGHDHECVITLNAGDFVR